MDHIHCMHTFGDALSRVQGIQFLNNVSFLEPQVFHCHIAQKFSAHGVIVNSRYPELLSKRKEFISSNTASVHMCLHAHRVRFV
jgi:hypothetical protein